jgi:SNF2 family DNA or RNA helicase
MIYLSRARQICTYPPLLKKSIERYEAVRQRTAAQAQAKARASASEVEASEVEASEAEASEVEASEVEASEVEAEASESSDEEDDGAEPLGVEGAEPLDYSLLLYGSESKMRAVMQTLVERQDNGNGKIVFCQFYQEIDAYERLLVSHGMTVAKFDGRIPHKKRQAVLNEPVDVLLAQLKMCREGLNLQAHYSEVYFPSPHFNPAVEAQAIARCWRIGQTKPVQVFRYLMSHTAPENAVQPYSLDGYTEKIQQIKRGLYEQMGALPPHPRIGALPAL